MPQQTGEQSVGRGKSTGCGQAKHRLAGKRGKLSFSVLCGQALLQPGIGASDSCSAPWGTVCLAVLCQRLNDKAAGESCSCSSFILTLYIPGLGSVV